jgi:hypothetical protein
MPWTIPDKGEGQNDIQSILFQEQLEILVEGLAGTNYVITGAAVTAQGTPDMTVAVSAGQVVSNGVLKNFTAGNATITTANATNPRLDLVVITSGGAIAVRAGTAAAAPKPPARTANDVVLAIVYVPANDTTISADQITDMRIVHQDHECNYLLSGSDYTNSTTTLSNVTGLAFEAAANGVYQVDVIGVMQSAATTTGMGLAFDIPSAGSVVGMIWHPTSGTALGSALQRADAAIIGTGTAGVDAATSDVPFRGSWIIVNGSTPGTVQLQARSEIAASQITIRGSNRTMMRVRRMA